MTAPPGRWRFTEAKTQQEFMANTFEHLLEQIQAHRKAINVGSDRHGISLDLEEGWKVRAEHEVCLYLPEGFCVDPDNPEPYRTELEKRGRQLWGELHEYARNFPEHPTSDEVKAAEKWFKVWRHQIPNWPGGCACQKHFSELLLEFPLVLDSGPAFYARTVEWHNRTNVRLGKPLWQG